MNSGRLFAHADHHASNVQEIVKENTNEGCNLKEKNENCGCCFNGFCFKYKCDDGSSSKDCPHDNCGPQKCASGKAENPFLIDTGNNIKILISEINILSIQQSYRSINAPTDVKNTTVNGIPIYISNNTLLI